MEGEFSVEKWSWKIRLMIAKICKDRKMSPADLAKLAGVTTHDIEHIEECAYGIKIETMGGPRDMKEEKHIAKTVDAICKALGISYEKLVQKTELIGKASSHRDKEYELAKWGWRVGLVLIRTRVKRNMGHTELAERAGVSKDDIRQIEASDYVGVATMGVARDRKKEKHIAKVVDAVCEVLGISSEELMQEAELLGNSSGHGERETSYIKVPIPWWRCVVLFLAICLVVGLTFYLTNSVALTIIVPVVFSLLLVFFGGPFHVFKCTKCGGIMRITYFERSKRLKILRCPTCCSEFMQFDRQ